MRRLSLLAALACLIPLLAACQISQSGPGQADGDVTPNAVLGGAIEVTALDAPADGASSATAAAPDLTGPESAAAQGAPPRPAALSEVPAEDAVAAEPAPLPELAEPVAEPKSERQLACEKKRGTWTRVGKGELRACVYRTRDSGKRCTRESQCEGVCLARSGTCSPVTPLFGCNEILQDNGARVTLCIE